MKYLLAIIVAVFSLCSYADSIVKPTVATRVHKPHPVVHPTIPKKPKILRSNPLRLSAIKLLDINPIDLPDDEDLITSSIHRPKLVKNPFEEDNTELSPEITVRLAVARAKAMSKYREVWV